LTKIKIRIPAVTSTSSKRICTQRGKYFHAFRPTEECGSGWTILLTRGFDILGFITHLSHFEIDGGNGFRNTYPNTALLAAISMQIVEGAAAYSQHRTDFPHLQGKRSKAPSKFCSVAL
jgi:hypothetical protein